jgi:glyoxylase-like metal-dependent hydrolase (beta-lactamase superfamily II)/ferredoxin
MATWERRHPDNAAGPFFVDESCIDCGTCWQVAPETFRDAGGHSTVQAQPQSAEAQRRALMALVACPTSSIGTNPKHDARAGADAFPERIDEGVHFCGYTSESSFGAWSWLVTRPEGNTLIDSPRAAGPLLRRIEAMGGVKRMLLTHRDDVADHAAIARRFGCERVIHEDDVEAETADVERRLAGLDPVRAGDFTLIPTPGHTRGHMVALLGETHLFTGDHLAWSPQRQRLIAFRSACWYSWSEQVKSMERLLDYRFEWVLPGHGQWWRAPSAAAMRREMERVVAWMKGRQ